MQKSFIGHFFKWPVMDRFTVYNAEKNFVGSTHPVAPYIQKRGRISTKVVLRNTLMYVAVLLQQNSTK